MGFLLFVKVNVALANRGLAQLDLPPGYAPLAQPAAPGRFEITRFDQSPLGPTFHRQARPMRLTSVLLRYYSGITPVS
jgi:hypothetical protein